MKIQIAFAVAACTFTGSLAQADEAKPQPAATPERSAGNATTVNEPAPKIAPSDRAAPNGGADGRVTIGGVKISRARFDVPASQPTGGDSTSVTRNDGLIDVPSNTLGPGESLQQRNERISAENRRIDAEAAIAQRESARSAPRDDDRDTLIVFGSGGRGLWYGGGYGGYGWNNWRGRSNGIVRSQTTGFEDDIHGQALKNFSDAAGAAIIDTDALHRNAILNFGQVSTPPLIEQQNQRDQSQINIRKAQPAPQRDQRGSRPGANK